MKPWRPMFIDVHPSALRRATAAWRVLPDFVIVGAQAAGTTSMYTHLRQHPNVMRSAVREVHFFDARFDRGVNWYRAFFSLRLTAALCGALRGGPMLTGESTPAYMFLPQATRRMAQTLPDAKVIAILRDPVDRAFSQYHKMVRKQQTDGETFEDLIDADKQAALHADWRRMAEDASFNNWDVQQFDMLTRGHYDDQVASLLEHYPAEQVMVIQSEAMFADTQAVYAHVLKFLGLAPYTLSNLEARNVGTYNQKVCDETEARLRAYFAPHNARLAELLGVEFPWPITTAFEIESIATPGKPRVVRCAM
ncbi:MAG: hypothetical protein GC159_04675 [Phycisphaera sp.]|nr:hypothetical protein [Phycisphaera sp.]